MCIYYYHGYTCGHVNKKCPPIPPILCRRHSRLPHEPMCDPPVYSIRHRREEIRCPECERVHKQCGERWKAVKKEWRHQMILPESAIQELGKERIRTMIETTRTGMRQGPSHITHRILNNATVNAVMEGDKLIRELIASNKDWESNMKSINRDFITEVEMKQVEWMRKRLEETFTDDASQMLSETKALIDNFYGISIKRRPQAENEMTSYSWEEFFQEQSL
ncbi:hypothetical protein GGR51DRAFT_501598 [Nemania sp. FL0031]|nr:hypothetical protein GGR51DRAFT_501598 [Nemania sp. FL0031]